VTARCLAARGIGEATAARSYLEPKLAGLRPPAGLAGMTTAVDRLAAAVKRGERIGCFGDYDVDGITTTALLASFLGQVGAACLPQVARRDAGYGFGVADAQGFADAGCTLIITGDCGTSDIAAISAARARGGDVVVVDHHTVPADRELAAHPALALVNPYRGDSTFPFRGMASVGLAFYLMVALRTRLRDDGWFRGGRAEPDVRELLDLVALGTVADLVPLQGENRILAAYGLRRIQERSRPGLDALMRVAGVDGERPIDERTIAWKLAPRLNAPGRLGDAAPSLQLLLAGADAADRWAAMLEEANGQRRVVQDQVYGEALEQLGGSDPGPAVVVAGRGWASGVVGIVAAKLVERYGRPAFVIAIDPVTGEGRGSARSGSAGVDLYRALRACEPLLVRFGGHAAAAGMTVREERVDALRESLGAAVQAQGAVAVSGSMIDAEVELGEVDDNLVGELGGLAPFGKGNEQPLLASRGLRVRSTRRVGEDGAHLKLELEDAHGIRREAIGFSLGDRDPGAGAHVDAVFVPIRNTFRGNTKVELEVRDLASC
jgi:single-stranded-DNA-specific exonuclease